MLVLAPGASGTLTSLEPLRSGLRRRAVGTRAVGLPRRRAEEAVPAYAEAIVDLRARADPLFIGGRSYGGRVASLVAADEPEGIAGLVLLSYPLHLPGRPEAGLRTSHWPSLRLPVLLLSGMRDPFARWDLLLEAVARHLPQAELVGYAGLGHGLDPDLEDVLDRIAAFVAGRPPRASGSVRRSARAARGRATSPRAAP
jgi:predicted alpha/beta-hydrolase family hydrolase